MSRLGLITRNQIDKITHNETIFYLPSMSFFLNRMVKIQKMGGPSVRLSRPERTKIFWITFRYNLGKLIKKEHLWFLFVSWKLPGWDEMQSFILSYQFQSQKHKSPNSFLLTQWLLIPVRLFSRKWSFWKEALGLNFKFRTKMTLLSNKSRATANFVMKYGSYGVVFDCEFLVS